MPSVDEVTVNMPPDPAFVSSKVPPFDDCKTIQVLVPIPLAILYDRRYDLGAEIYEQVREEINRKITEYRKGLGR